MSLEDFLKLLPDDDGKFVLTLPDYYVLAKDSDFEYIIMKTHQTFTKIIKEVITI